MKWIICGLCFFLGLYIVVNLGLGVMKGYSWNDMDWNENGTVGLHEIMRAKDIGLRKSERGCKEYFSYKDGQPIRTVCPSENSAITDK
ncbi:hypothetical protein LG331_02975 [Vreelandella aquamarina]|uniref:hypothetical protein n=1 Tax=Vreelandella aquamarina TaxID=77097 RepID=UPI00384C1066